MVNGRGDGRGRHCVLRRESYPLKRIALILWTEPVVVLSASVGVTGVLAKEHIISGWIPLALLAVVTPIQRALVTPR